MNTLIMVVVMVVSMLLPILMAAGAIFWEKRQRRLQGRRSPVKDKLAHLPGEQLRARMTNLTDKIDEYVVQLLVVGPFVVLIVLLPRVQWSALKFSWLDALVLFAGIGVTVWNIKRLLPLWREYRQCKDGLRAEIAVAQQLDRLQAQDCVVVHDIPVGDFNIDHVVIGTSAVFAVETKSRRKSGDGKASANVEFDGKTLKFPSWAETRPLDQARAQADWLANYLKGETGEAIPVIPVLCLPGWFVQHGKDAHRSDVRVINPKMTSLFVDAGARPRLQVAQRNRIVHALHKKFPEIGE